MQWWPYLKFCQIIPYWFLCKQMQSSTALSRLILLSNLMFEKHQDQFIDCLLIWSVLGSIRIWFCPIKGLDSPVLGQLRHPSYSFRGLKIIFRSGQKIQTVIDNIYLSQLSWNMTQRLIRSALIPMKCSSWLTINTRSSSKSKAVNACNENLVQP